MIEQINLYNIEELNKIKNKTLFYKILILKNKAVRQLPLPASRHCIGALKLLI